MKKIDLIKKSRPRNLMPRPTTFRNRKILTRQQKKRETRNEQTE